MRGKILNQTLKQLVPTDKPFELRDTDIKGFLLRVQPSGVMTYYLEYRAENGKKQRYRIGDYPSMTPTEARRVAEGRYADVAKGKDLQAEKKAARERAAKERYETLGGFIELWYAPWAVSNQKRGAETLQLLQSNFGDLYQKRLEKITSWDVQRWRTTCEKRGLKPATINRRLVMLKSVFNRAVEAEVVASSPLTSIKPLRVDDKARVRFLSDVEEVALREALDQRERQMGLGRRSGNQWREQRGYSSLPELDGKFADYLKPMVLLALNTGMRRGEIFTLTWQEVDFDRKLVTVVGRHSKSGKTRHINLNSEMCQLLRDWQLQAGGDLVFSNPVTGEKFDNIKSSWTRLREDAGIADFRFHDLRHTFASKLVMAGASLYTVKELMGHSSFEMTERYAHLAPEHTARAVEMLVRG